MEQDEVDNIVSILKKIRRRAKEKGISANAIRFVDIVLCRIYVAKLDSVKIMKTLSEAKNTLLSDLSLSPEEIDYIENINKRI